MNTERNGVSASQDDSQAPLLEQGDGQTINGSNISNGDTVDAADGEGARILNTSKQTISKTALGCLLLQHAAR